MLRANRVLMMTTQPQHISVMLDECVELLAPVLQHEHAVYVDATLGLGGHAARVLEAAPQAKLIGIDRDTEAVAIARSNLARFGDRVTVIHAANDAIAEILRQEAPNGIDAVLFDLGVSSLQLDEAERGFSYMSDATLDMRMDTTQALTAKTLVAERSVDELARIFRDYGDEKYALRIAKRIAKARDIEPISTTEQLVKVVESALPTNVRYRPGHSAKRVFQALRVVVNDELSILHRALPQALDALNVAGRAVIMSFQSDEDRIVKHVLRAATADHTPQGVPAMLPDAAPIFRTLTHGTQRPTEEEIAVNSRSASVKLRAVEKLRDAEVSRYVNTNIRGEMA